MHESQPQMPDFRHPEVYSLPSTGVVDSKLAPPVEPITIIGAGTLGKGMAAVLSRRGNTVNIVDQKADVLEEALKDIVPLQDQALKDFPAGSKGTIKGFTDSAEAVPGSWLIIEAVPENPDLKRTVLGELDELADKDAIIVTNSSSYPSSQLIDKVKHPERIANLHFMMPPAVTSCELMSDGKTSRKVLDKLLGELPKFGVYPFEAKKESLGFIINRVWAAMKREALEVIYEGVSTPQEFDALFASVYGLPIFRMIDMVGLDVALDIENHYNEAYGTPPGPRKVLEKYIQEGKLGRKSGAGFYDDYKK